MVENQSNPGNPWLSRSDVSGQQYDAPYRAKLAAGENVHGEADFVEALAPMSVLDAGCGTGRVAIELARRGIEVAGADIDPRMLSTAQSKAPHLQWHLGDLATLDLGRDFDVILLAGNVMIFLAPGAESAVLENMARHLVPGGRLIAGFQLMPGRLSLEEYDRIAGALGLTLEGRYATWGREPWSDAATYAVSVHRF